MIHVDGCRFDILRPFPGREKEFRHEIYENLLVNQLKLRALADPLETLVTTSDRKKERRIAVAAAKRRKASLRKASTVAKASVSADLVVSTVTSSRPRPKVALASASADLVVSTVTSSRPRPKVALASVSADLVVSTVTSSRPRPNVMEAAELTKLFKGVSLPSSSSLYRIQVGNVPASLVDILIAIKNEATYQITNGGYSTVWKPIQGDLKRVMVNPNEVATGSL
jgi:hypothetical protein